MVLAFLHSALQVAIIKPGKRATGWRAAVGWLVHTTLAGPALRRRSCDQIQDVLA